MYQCRVLRAMIFDMKKMRLLFFKVQQLCNFEVLLGLRILEKESRSHRFFEEFWRAINFELILDVEVWRFSIERGSSQGI